MLKEKIKDLCKSKNISLKQVENELGFANGYLSKIDQASPSAMNLQKIAIYFDVSLDWLLGMQPLPRLYADGTIAEPIVKEDGTVIYPQKMVDGSFIYPETEQMPIEEARTISHNIKNVIDYYTDPATAEMMQKLFESPGRRALFNAVADMDEESVQKYADFIERITHDNNQSN